MPKIYSSIACNLDSQVLSAAYPLLAEGKVDSIEWSFDTLYKVSNIPFWFEELVAFYSRENRLIGHGVFFSLFSGRWSADQQDWLKQLRHTCKLYKFDHITEHFGFMTGKDFLPGSDFILGPMIEDDDLFQQQRQLAEILENAASYDDAMFQLQASALANSSWEVELWQPYMLETARKIAQKWK